MESLQATQDHELKPDQFNRLFEEVDQEIWELRGQDEYLNTYERISEARPNLNRHEIEATILKNTAESYAEAHNFDQTKQAAFILFAAAPDYAIQQAHKNIHGSSERVISKISQFNDVARDFVTLHPEIDIDKLVSRLTESVVSGEIQNDLDDDYQLEHSFSMTLEGVRTEVGLEQLFTYAEIPYERATTAQDLKGVDYIIPIAGKVLKLDAKSSSTGVGTQDKAYQRVGQNHFKLLRPFRDSDFKGRSFKLREDSMRNKVDGTWSLIEEMAQ